MLGRRGRFWYRFAARRAAAGAAVLLACAVVASAAVSHQSQAVVHTALDQNWRGAYDLLVSSPGDALGAAAVSTAGVVEQNFASFAGSGGISTGQLASIRAIPGVDVAAPLTYLGSLRTAGAGVMVGARADAPFFSSLKAFDVSVRVWTSDGVVQKTLHESSATVVTDSMDSGAPVIAATGPGNASTSSDGSADVAFPGTPELSSGIVAVDPVAEAALLRAAGAPSGFLDPLQTFDAALASHESSKSLAALVPMSFESEHYSVLNAPQGTQPVPLVLSDSAYAPLHATVTVTPVHTTASRDEMLGALNPAMSKTGYPATLSATAEQTLAAAPRGKAQVTELDLKHALAPFVSSTVSTALPGATAAPGGSFVDTSPALVLRTVQRSVFRRDTAASPPAGVDAHFLAPALGPVTLGGTRATEQTYRADGHQLPTDAAPLWAPLGRYSPSAMAAASTAVSYVPLGTYAAGTATVVQPGPDKGDQLQPSFSGRGLVLGAPGAITTLEAAQQLSPGSGIDVVRVRVALNGGYTPANVQRISAVATRIAHLGLSVRVVAGSSLTPTAVYLPTFFTDGPRSGADLGWTVSEWTSMGAALRVEDANAQAGTFLFVLALAAACLLAGAVQVVGVHARRPETALLTSLGWSRRRIFGWYAAEAVPGMLVVAAAMLVALVWFADNPFTPTAVGTATLAYVLIVGAGTWTSARTRTRRRRGARRTRPARTVRTMAVSAVRARPGSGVLMAMALAVLAGSITGLGHVLVQAHSSAGNSRLAGAVSAAALIPYTAMAATCLIAGISLYLAGTRQLRASLDANAAILVAGGWQVRRVIAYLRVALLVPGLAGVVLAAAVVIGADRFTPATAHAWWIAPTAAITVLIAVTLSLLGARRGVPGPHESRSRTLAPAKEDARP